MEKEILFQTSDEGFENIMIFARLRDNKLYFFSKADESKEYEDIRDYLKVELELFQEDKEVKHNLAKRINMRKKELIEKFNAKDSLKIRTIL